MSYDRNEDVHVAPLERVAQSKKSMKVKYPDAPDDAGVWIPLSQIAGTDLTVNGAHGHLVIPFWLAEDRGLEGAIIDPGDPNDAPSEPAQDVGADSGAAGSTAASDAVGVDEPPPF